MHVNQMIKRASLLGLAAAALLGVVGVSAASASSYSQFSECPLENAKVEYCIHSLTVGGEAKIGDSALFGQTTVPIVNPITLQGGYYESNTATEELTFLGTKKGGTILTPVGQPVPGGLAGLINCTELGEPFKAACKLVFENGFTGVNAVTELAAKSASEVGISTNNLVNGEGVALRLPVKIRLENAFLGSKCYIGSNSNQIIWNLTSGPTAPPPPNKSIHGKTGKITINPATNIVEVMGSELVDNAYSAPEVSGCGGFPLEYILDPIIEAKLGVPAAGGINTIKLDNEIELVTAETIHNKG
jgi:hypothetical protein